MATTARAAVFFGPGKPFEIKSVPIPEIEPDGVLIRVTSAAPISTSGAAMRRCACPTTAGSSATR
jgi:Zn-dependent alcohol dehydrogenase